MDFDRSGSRSNYDARATVTKLKVNVPNAEEVNVSFILGETAPKILFLELQEKRVFSRDIELGSFVVSHSDGILKPGLNEIKFQRKIGDGKVAALAKRLEKGKTYQLDMGVSNDGKMWGPRVTKPFSVKN